ncbi:Thromboxane-A synthase [Porites harrisoni]
MGFGRRPTIVITDPEMIKQITIKEFPKFQNRWFPEVNPPMSSFLFIAKDDQWKRIRTTLSPTFSATKLKEVIPLMEEASDVLTGKLTEAAKTRHSTDVNPLFSLFALEVILSAAFGMQADIQSNPDSDTVEKAKNVFRTPLWVRAFSMFPLYDFVNSLDYLDQVFCEVLRLYTPGYLVQRRCIEACTINGITIPQNVDVFMPPYLLHRDPALWPDPEKFDPDRFSPENRDTQEAYSYMPFGVGPRQCIGFRFALLEMKTAMFKILSRVKFHAKSCRHSV